MIWEWRKICSVTNPFRVWRQTKKVDLFCYKEHYTWSQKRQVCDNIIFILQKHKPKLMLTSYNLCKIWNVNPFFVLKISFISLIHYICNELTYICMWILYLTQLDSLLILIYFLPFSTFMPLWNFVFSCNALPI